MFRLAGRSARLAAAALAGACLAGASLAQEVTLKVHHFWPPVAMPPSTILKPWTERIEKESGGRIKFQIYPAMQLGGAPPQLIDQARDGIADIVWTLPGYTAGRFPIMEVFELPFMTFNAEAASRAAWEYYTQFGYKEFPGIKALAVNVHDQGYIHTRDKQIRTMADFKGLKMRAPTRQTNKLLAALGATPVSMPLPAIADAVSKGVVDGFMLPWEVIPAIKGHEMVKFHSETDPKVPALYTAVFILAMNQKRYDSLPADLKAIIDRNSGLELSALAGRTWDESKPRFRQLAVDRGNTFYTIPASELDAWQKSTAGVADEWVKDVTAKGNDGAAMLRTARDLIKKHTKN